MEKKMNELKDQLTEATANADKAKEKVDKLEAIMKDKQQENKQLANDYARLKEENLKQAQDALTLQGELDKQVNKAAEAAAAATTLEMETTRLLAELKEQGVTHSNTLEKETTALKGLLDDQSAEAVDAKTKFEKAEAEKRRLRDEMDQQIAEAAMKAAEAQAVTDKVMRDLAEAKTMNQEYLRAIQEIASVAASITETPQTTEIR
jgi:chromosome segregation ATPase